MPLRIRKTFKTFEDFGPLRLRLQRFGQNGYPFYNIVAAQARFRRNGRAHQVLGTYCPIPTEHGTKHITLDFDKAKFWIAHGAEPTPMVAKILSKAGLLPSPPKEYEIRARQIEIAKAEGLV